MAKLSSWMALLAALAITTSMAMSGVSEFGAIGPIIAALLLVLGAYRTLRAMAGGLRLLCGAWGIATGSHGTLQLMEFQTSCRICWQSARRFW